MSQGKSEPNDGYPIGTSTIDFIKKAIGGKMSQEVKKYIENECDAVLECKLCKELFRSPLNFVQHKRTVCKVPFVNAHLVESIDPEDYTVSSQPASTSKAIARAGQVVLPGARGPKHMINRFPRRNTTRNRSALNLHGILRARSVEVDVPLPDGQIVQKRLLPQIHRKVPKTKFIGGVQMVTEEVPLVQEPSDKDKVVMVRPEAPGEVRTMRNMKLRTKIDESETSKSAVDLSYDEIRLFGALQVIFDFQPDAVSPRCPQSGSCAELCFPSLESLALHLARVHPVKGVEINCILCMLAQPDYKSMLEHFDTVHGDVPEPYPRELPVVKKSKRKSATTGQPKSTSVTRSTTPDDDERSKSSDTGPTMRFDNRSSKSPGPSSKSSTPPLDECTYNLSTDADAVIRDFLTNEVAIHVEELPEDMLLKDQDFDFEIQSSEVQLNEDSASSAELGPTADLGKRSRSSSRQSQATQRSAASNRDTDVEKSTKRSTRSKRAASTETQQSEKESTKTPKSSPKKTSSDDKSTSPKSSDESESEDEGPVGVSTRRMVRMVEMCPAVVQKSPNKPVRQGLPKPNISEPAPSSDQKVTPKSHKKQKKKGGVAKGNTPGARELRSVSERGKTLLISPKGIRRLEPDEIPATSPQKPQSPKKKGAAAAKATSIADRPEFSVSLAPTAVKKAVSSVTTDNMRAKSKRRAIASANSADAKAKRRKLEKSPEVSKSTGKTPKLEGKEPQSSSGPSSQESSPSKARSDLESSKIQKIVSERFRKILPKEPGQKNRAFSAMVGQVQIVAGRKRAPKPGPSKPQNTAWVSLEAGEIAAEPRGEIDSVVSNKVDAIYADTLQKVIENKKKLYKNAFVDVLELSRGAAASANVPNLVPQPQKRKPRILMKKSKRPIAASETSSPSSTPPQRPASPPMPVLPPNSVPSDTPAVAPTRATSLPAPGPGSTSGEPAAGLVSKIKSDPDGQMVASPSRSSRRKQQLKGPLRKPRNAPTYQQERASALDQQLLSLARGNRAEPTRTKTEDLSQSAKEEVLAKKRVRRNRRLTIHAANSLRSDYRRSERRSNFAQRYMDNKAMACLLCAFEAETPLTLRFHVLGHYPQDTYTCGRCGYLTWSQRRQRLHLHYRHGVSLVKKRRLRPRGLPVPASSHAVARAKGPEQAQAPRLAGGAYAKLLERLDNDPVAVDVEY